jgi:protein-L-isoaspartate(D-aspartate) O-methyltransferase
MIDLDAYRRFFAEEIETVANLKTPALVDALAAVPRERFLRPGPWAMLADQDFVSGAVSPSPGAPRTRTTVDADPRRVYHNVAVAIEPARALFNGQPGTLAVWLDALGLAPGARVLHIGCGLGYYTALIAQAVGAGGRVVAFEVDDGLAADAQRNLETMPWVDVRHGDGSTPLNAAFDAILVNAGVTHPLETWLDALAPGGRMVLPLTATMPAIGSTIGKGLALLLTEHGAADLAVRIIGFVAVYSAVGVRDDSLNASLGKALMGGPAQWQGIARLRRDAHEPSLSCWFHGPTWCLSRESS